MNSYFLKSALLPSGWQADVRVTTDQGFFTEITTDTSVQPGDEVLDVVIPALPNIHSHVFQRAMAGRTEYKSAGQDSFWSWRELMYQLANDIDADDLYRIAKDCYAEMQAAGYASVCEFHYVHRDLKDPDNYYRHAEVLLQAAAEVGLPITLMPVLYAFSAVGEQPLHAEQKRFELSVDEYLDLWQHLQKKLQPAQTLGLCFHSIRAVSQQQMQQLIEAVPQDTPIHIHIAEQQAEVQQALDHYGLRPVQWLFKHFEVNERWCLVHATHLDDEEVKQLAASGAVAGLCPLTEANLGDGIFPMPAYQQAGGHWAIGSDSHIEINPASELKMLEYSQRLHHQQRNVCCDAAQPHVGTWMWLQAVAAGNQISGMPVAGLAVGQPAAVINLTPESNDQQAPQVLDGWVFSDRTEYNSRRL